MDSVVQQKRKSFLPIIALVFASAPALWLPWYAPIPGTIIAVFLALFLLSYFGVILQIIGLILGVIALFVMIKRNSVDVKSVVFSIIAILAPFVWIYVLFSGGIDYILSYK